MNGTHRVLTYADDVHLIGRDIKTIEGNTDVLLNACKDMGLAVNIGKTKYMEIGRLRGMIANGHLPKKKSKPLNIYYYYLLLLSPNTFIFSTFF